MEVLKNILRNDPSICDCIMAQRRQKNGANKSERETGFAWEKTHDPKNPGFLGGFFGFFQSNFEKTRVFSKFCKFFKKNFLNFFHLTANPGQVFCFLSNSIRGADGHVTGHHDHVTELTNHITAVLLRQRSFFLKTAQVT